MMMVADPGTLAASAGPGLHIPDGFISLPISVVGWVVMAVVIALAGRMTNRSLNERAVPLMGAMAAFIFAAQMMNFPVAGGTSGHMLGGVLAAVLLGPWAAIIVMTAVVGLQAVLFQDGGIVVLGVNVLNMGVITVLVGTLVYRAAEPFARSSWMQLTVAFVAAWLSVEVAAIATALQLAASGTSPLGVVLPAMVGVHALIGIGEGLITVAALRFILSTRPDLMPRAAAGQA
ncbi:MAG: energy-coupling factor ABC transporter permease [Dehalococcoidia bacterium]